MAYHEDLTINKIKKLLKIIEGHNVTLLIENVFMFNESRNECTVLNLVKNIKIKNMETGNESEMELADFAENFQAKVIADAMSEFESLGMEGFDLSTLLGGAE